MSRFTSLSSSPATGGRSYKPGLQDAQPKGPRGAPIGSKPGVLSLFGFLRALRSKHGETGATPAARNVKYPEIRR